jgi:NAD(P)-dependent dehydrogenase (short-subunit alcohol dehydrogenase family)
LATLEGKVAIVTGSGQGIGRGMAIALAKAGAKVVIAEINPDTGMAVAEEIRKLGLQAVNVQCDVGVEAQCQRMVDIAVKEFGPIDILINNAQALFGDPAPIEEFPLERWDRTYQTGIKATWHCCKAVFPYMKERGGTIINFGSGMGMYGFEGWSDYAGCKEAIRGFSRTAAKEWKKYKIRVYVSCPGIDSPSARAAAAKHPEIFGMVTAGLGDPERDAGALVVSLASSDSDLQTGHTFIVGKDSVIAQYP